MTYLSFPRGINVGGRTIKMIDLQKAFESFGATNVKTFLASGNVMFDSTENDIQKLSLSLDSHLSKTFSMNITTIIRSISDLQNLATSHPFANIKVTKDTRLYVTFLPEGISGKEHADQIPKNESFFIVYTTEKEVCTVLTLSPEKNTTDLMKVLEKVYGKNITTRNWNTITRIIATL